MFLLAVATSLHAQDAERIAKQTRIEKQSATLTGDRGLFTVPSVETLNKGQFSFGAGWSNLDRTPKDVDINTFPVSFSIGVISRLTVTGTFETQRQVKVSNVVQTGFNPEFPYAESGFQKGPGDAYLSGKYRVWRQPDNVGGMAIKGFVKFGTADPKKGLGTGQTDGGIDLIFTSAMPWKFHDFLLHSTMGFTATRDGKDPRPIKLKDQLRSGLGLVFPSTHPIQGIFEYVTSTAVGASSPNAASVTVINPSDVRGGLRVLLLDRGLTFSAGYTINTKFDRKFPNNRQRTGLVVGLSYTKPVKSVGNNHYPVLALEADNTEIPADGSASIVATGFDADNDSLTYSWTSTGGKVEGTGDKVMFRAAGLTPGKYTVRATAADGKGGIATSELEITVRQ